MTARDPLSARLFGYAILYRVRIRGDVPGSACEPVPVAADQEARALALELDHHLGRTSPAARSVSDPEDAAVSLPFGRCGIAGRPCEHVRLYHFERAFLDVVAPGRAWSVELAAGQTVRVEPGTVVRFRARPRAGRRVLVAFQTEDRTPLHGHAAPLSLDGCPVPGHPAERLRHACEAFSEVWRGLEAGRPASSERPASERLERFFADIAAVVSGDDWVEAARKAAVTAGSYEAGASEELFARARDLLNPSVLQRIREGDTQVFRFPGMFGAVAPLFPLLRPG